MNQMADVVQVAKPLADIAFGARATHIRVVVRLALRLAQVALMMLAVVEMLHIDLTKIGLAIVARSWDIKDFRATIAVVRASPLLGVKKLAGVVMIPARSSAEGFTTEGAVQRAIGAALVSQRVYQNSARSSRARPRGRRKSR